MTDLPLCVDLDGTLILGDVLAESLLFAVTARPGLFFRMPFWLLRGRAFFKQELARCVAPDFSLLPVNQPLLDYLREQRQAGRRLVLVTAADLRLAREAAARVGLFDEVIGSEGVVNLAGRHKAELLEKRFGRGGFDYAGNERRDLAVWAVARGGIVAGRNPALAQKAAQLCEVEKTFLVPPSTAGDWLRALRVHQWTKNLLLFIPILGAHAWKDSTKLQAVLLGFLVFCLGASSAYLLNDLLDLESDRHHRSKRGRPLASGRISLTAGIIALVLLLAAAVALTLLALPASFGLVFAGYYLLTFLYSHQLKRIVLIDVLALAALYGIRIFAGGHAAQVPVSSWLLAFSLFLFLSLALTKRFTELRAVPPDEKTGLKGRGYQPVDLELVGSMGVASGYIAVLVLAFYINSPDVATLYRHPTALWTACLVILYWISRIWLSAYRGALHEDPVVFAIKDRASWLAGLLLILIALVAAPK